MLKKFWNNICLLFKIPPRASTDKEIEERRKKTARRIVMMLSMRDSCD